MCYSACAGGGYLHTVDALGADEVARRTCGLRAVPNSRRLGADLQRMHAAALEGLRECVRLVSRRLVPLVAQACGQRWGSVPVFVDDPGIEVEGKLFENDGRGYHGERQFWLPSVFVGVAWVSARLHAGGTDVQGDGRDQLDQDVAPLLTGRQPVWLRADSAYYCKDLASYCRRKGWEYSVSVTDPRQKAPMLRLAAARGLREDEGEPLDAAGKERAIVVAYRPARWPEEQVYAVIRRDGDGEQRLLEPVSTVMLVSRDRLPVAELVRRHRGAASRGRSLRSRGRCRTWGCIIRRAARTRRIRVSTWAGRSRSCCCCCSTRRCRPRRGSTGCRPLIRYFVCSMGRLTRSARRLRLLCSRSNLQLDWLLPAASRREPAQRQGTDAEPAGGSVRPQPGVPRLRCGRRPAQGACGGAQVARRQD